MIATEAELTAWGREVGVAAAAWEAEDARAGLAGTAADGAQPTVLLLHGPLGAGKSTLARAIARGAGVESNLPSPTFNLVFRYHGSSGLPITHADLYRIESPAELDGLGWDELLTEGLVMVEWPERAEGRLPRARWEISLGFVSGRPDVRELVVRRVGDAPPIDALARETAAPESV